MEKIYLISKRVGYIIRSRIQAVFLLISILAILFIFLKLVNIELIPFVSMNPILLFLIDVLIASSAIFSVLFLPSYPLILFLLRSKNFVFREKLSIIIVSNLSYYIIIGFIGSWINFPITFEYFFFNLLLTYLLLILIVNLIAYRRGIPLFFKKTERFKRQHVNYENFSLTSFIFKSLSLNGILLIAFICLICVVNLFNTSIFAGLDPWLHISIVRYISELNYIPMDEYYGALGLHIFGTVIHFFSGVKLILLPKLFMFYTIPLFSLILYNIFRRIFNNKNLAIFGVFLLMSSLGFSWFMLVQFWPSGITLIQGLVIFFLLYVRLQGLIKDQIPKKEELFSSILFSYALSIFIFISALLTHSLLAMLILISFLWVYLIYFATHYRRGFDLLLLTILFCIFLIFYTFNISTGYFQVFDPFRIIPWYYFLLGGFGFALLIAIILLFYRRSMDFSSGRFKSIITGKSKSYYKKIEDKYIFTLILASTIILSIIFAFFNFLIMNISVTYIIYFTDILLISFFAIWGIFLFRYKPRGKFLFIWGIALDALFLSMFLYDAYIGFTTFFLRVFFITTIIISIGFVSYLYKLLKLNSFQKNKFKVFLISLVIFSVYSQNLFDTTTIDIFCLHKQEVNSIQWYSKYSSNKDLVISKFGWYAIFIYYDYPFEDKNKTLPLDSIYSFLVVDNELVHPNLHISNGSNVLKNLKSLYNTDVILILPDEFYSPFSWTFFEQLSEDEIEAYYNLDYLNRIYSSKGEDGKELPYYWVI